MLANNAAAESFRQEVANFNAANPTRPVTAVAIDGGTEALLARLADTPPDQWPDVIVSQPQALRRLVDTGRVVPPDECGSVEATIGHLLPVVRGAYMFDGVLQAVPYGVSTPILLFDAAEYRAAGLDPMVPPTSLEELAAASKQIVDSGASPYGLVVYDWFGRFLIEQGAAQRGDLVALPDNGRSRERMTVDYAVDDNIDALRWLVDVVRDSGGVYIGGIPSGLENLLKIVDPTQGGTMTIQTSGALGDVIGYLESGTFPGVELGVGPMPGPAGGGLVGGNGLWLVDHGDPVQVATSYEFVTWLVTPQRLAEFVALTGYVPPSVEIAAQPAVVDRWTEYPGLRVGFDQLVTQTASSADAGPVFGPSVEIDYVFYRLTNRVLVDGVTPERALAELTVDVQNELDRYDAIVGG